MNKPTKLELAKRLQEYALPRYEEGYDVFVECGIEYCLTIVEGSNTWKEVKKFAATIVEIRLERQHPNHWY